MLDVRDLEVRYGAGKSSTLRAIAGAIRPARGRITLDGTEVPYGWPERMVRLGTAMVPETRDVFPDLTVEENLKLGAFTRRRDPAGMADDHARVVELFPVLGERAGQPAGTLSGGEQQMLVIARALMSRPRLLLLDEPSLGLAPTIIERIFAMIAELKKTGLTILLVEQNAAQGLAVADHAFVMRLGEIAAGGPAAAIRAATDLKALYLGGQA
jgi:branched-chain amino acid transport system ATP-binding protein